jgi:hypothetical protein
MRKAEELYFNNILISIPSFPPYRNTEYLSTAAETSCVDEI